MAIEDAIALAGELCRSASIEAAFAAYDRSRAGSASRRSSPGAHAAAATRCPDNSGESPATRCCASSSWVITEKSYRWMYDYRIGLERPPRARAAEVPG